MTGERMIRIEPLGVDLAVHDGETVMAAAQRFGLHWPTVCHGLGECLVCRLEVLAASPPDPPLTTRERDAFGSGRLRPGERGEARLACQLRPVAEMTIFKAGVRPRGPVDHMRRSP